MYLNIAAPEYPKLSTFDNCDSESLIGVKDLKEPSTAFLSIPDDTRDDTYTINETSL